MPGFVNYKKGRTRLASASAKVYQFLAHARWFSPGTPASSTTKTGRHDIAEILLKVAFTINQSINQSLKLSLHNIIYQVTSDQTNFRSKRDNSNIEYVLASYFTIDWVMELRRLNKVKNLWISQCFLSIKIVFYHIYGRNPPSNKCFPNLLKTETTDFYNMYLITEIWNTGGDLKIIYTKYVDLMLFLIKSCQHLLSCNRLCSHE